MPTSTATIKRDDLIKRSFRRIGIDYASVTQINSAAALLNDIVKEIDTEGRWLWAISNTPVSFNTILSQRSYGTAEALGSSIASDILQLEWAEIVQGTALRPLRIIYELESLSNIQREATGGQPYFAYLERKAKMVDQRVHLFPSPGGIYKVQYTYRRRLYDFAASTDNPDFPQDWDQRLVKRLALELAPEYGLPLEERALLQAQSEEAMRAGKSANNELITPRPERSFYF